LSVYCIVVRRWGCCHDDLYILSSLITQQGRQSLLQGARSGQGIANKSAIKMNQLKIKKNQSFFPQNHIFSKQWAKNL
jgi:hypothetical protein